MKGVLSMNQRITVHYNNQPVYDIKFEESYDNLYIELEKLGAKDRKFCIISDTNVSKHYLNEVKELLENKCALVETFIIQAGEQSKNLNTVSSLYEHLIESKFDRNDILIALGGGVVGDLTGYAAATYLRGIRFIQLPTSLLAMVDSSIGGKTGVDFNAYKNMVGAFHQPDLVYINLKTLYTLSDSQFNSGLSEIIKHGLIKDFDYYEWLKENQTKIKEKDIDILKEMIYKSCIIKKEVVELDPTEKGERALLNFGHTIGHSVEKLMEFSLLHGECVSIGIVAASYLSLKRGSITKEQYEDIVHTLKNFHLPVTISNLDTKEVVDVTKIDKKMEAGQIKFILLDQIGKAVIDKNVTDEEMSDAIKYITC